MASENNRKRKDRRGGQKRVGTERHQRPDGAEQRFRLAVSARLRRPVKDLRMTWNPRPSACISHHMTAGAHDKKAVFRDSCLVSRDPKTEAGGTAVAQRRMRCSCVPCSMCKGRDSCLVIGDPRAKGGNMTATPARAFFLRPARASS